MNIEEIIFVLNLSKIDIADHLIEDCQFNCTESEYIDSLLEDKKLSLLKIENSIASIVYHNNQLNIQFLNIMDLYKISNLELLDKGIYFQMLDFFYEPRKVKIIKPTYQVGGVIDINYGIKFTIQLESNKKQLEEMVTDATIKEFLDIPQQVLDDWKKKDIAQYNRKIYEIIKGMSVKELKSKALKISSEILTF